MQALKTSLIVLLLTLVVSSGCGSDMEIKGHTYTTVGLLNPEEKDPCIKYKTIVGNVIWSVILIETVAAPIYFLGFSIQEPVGPKEGCSTEKTIKGP